MRTQQAAGVPESQAPRYRQAALRPDVPGYPVNFCQNRSVEAPEGSPTWLEVFTADERPDLWERCQSQRLFDAIWPEYNMHGTHAARYFGVLSPRFARFQALFIDRRADEVIARARTVPFWWDRRLENLPEGIDAVGIQAVEDSRTPTALSALSAEVRSQYQGTGLSALVLATMVTLARQAGLAPLVAPVRPSWKDRFPLNSIDDYASWQRHDGLPYDPWIRVHIRLGARILRPEPKSMEFTAQASEWEAWTGMYFHRDGSYVFTGGLAPLTVTDDVGRYWEPNVWMLHEVSS
jgi:GNAT superfamily N-acetyltransferase